jgi:hypothetical protein
MNTQILRKFISDFERQCQIYEDSNKGFDHEYKLSTFKICLFYKDYEFRYFNETSFLINGIKIDIKKDEDFVKFLEYIKSKGYTFKCLEENGCFLYIVLRKTSMFHYVLKYLDMCI